MQQNARAADFLEFADLLRDLLEAQGVGIVLAWCAVKCAEVTTDIANVGVIDVAVIGRSPRQGGFLPGESDVPHLPGRAGQVVEGDDFGRASRAPDRAI